MEQLEECPYCRELMPYSSEHISKCYQNISHQRTENLYQIQGFIDSSHQEVTKPVPKKEYLRSPLLGQNTFSSVIVPPANPGIPKNFVLKQTPEPSNSDELIAKLLQEEIDEEESKNFAAIEEIDSAPRPYYEEYHELPLEPQDYLDPIEQHHTPSELCQRTFKPHEAKVDCSICMCEFEPGETVTTLPCFHEFHHKCVLDWLKTKPVCPYCKHAI